MITETRKLSNKTCLGQMPKDLRLFLNEKEWQENEKQLALARKDIKSPALGNVRVEDMVHTNRVRGQRNPLALSMNDAAY